jgi:formate dehydrogenase major subunit
MNAITRIEREQADASTVTFLLDGREITARHTDTLIEIADREGIEIPRLCYKAGMEAVGNCRSCMVEIKGERVLAASCCRSPVNGMQVTTNNERVKKSQQMVIELLQSDMPEKEYTRGTTRSMSGLPNLKWGSRVLRRALRWCRTIRMPRSPSI